MMRDMDSIKKDREQQAGKKGDHSNSSLHTHTAYHDDEKILDFIIDAGMCIRCDVYTTSRGKTITMLVLLFGLLCCRG